MINNRLKSGNSKLDKGVLIFDLPAVKTCPNSSDCKDRCYGFKGEWRPCVRQWRQENWVLAKSGRLWPLLRAQLARTGKRIVRIHSSGDWYSQDYLDNWVGIAREFPNIRFYVYTKTITHCPERGRRDFTDVPDNMNVIDSYIDGKVNFGSPSYVKAMARHGAFVCPVTDYSTAQCMKDCDYCLEGNRPVFYEH